LPIRLIRDKNEKNNTGKSFFFFCQDRYRLCECVPGNGGLIKNSAVPISKAHVLFYDNLLLLEEAPFPDNLEECQLEESPLLKFSFIPATRGVPSTIQVIAKRSAFFKIYIDDSQMVQ
jgi:hypothetical protein